MCGRYRSRAEKQQIADEYYARLAESLYFRASYNIAPQTFQPVVRLSEEDGEREVVLMRLPKGVHPYSLSDRKPLESGAKAPLETVRPARLGLWRAASATSTQIPTRRANWVGWEAVAKCQ